MGSLRLFTCIFKDADADWAEVPEHSTQMPASSAQRACDMLANELEDANIGLRGMVVSDDGAAAEVLTPEDRLLDRGLRELFKNYRSQ